MNSSWSIRSVLTGVAVATISTTLLWAAFPGLSTTAKNSPEDDKASPDRPSRLRSLKLEYRDALAELLDVEQRKLAAGTSIPATVHQAALALLNAELDLADDRDQRIRILEKAVENSRAWEKIARQRFEVGTAGRADVVFARAARLNSQIRLEREKTGG